MEHATLEVICKEQADGSYNISSLKLVASDGGADAAPGQAGGKAEVAPSNAGVYSSCQRRL
jgi:hypothetical protein